MQLFSTILQSLQVISSILVIVLVLLQQGKGADMGAAFGSGSAGSVFGAAGAANFLSRATKWAAIVFFATTGGLAWVAHHPSGSPLDSGVMQGFSASTPEQQPASGNAVPQLDKSVPDVSGSLSVPGPANDAAADSQAAVPEVGNAADSAAAVPQVPVAPDNSVPTGN